MKKTVSVIIPSYNRGHLLERIIPSYFQKEVGEVILVDDASSDNTEAVVKTIQKRFPNLIYLRHNTNKKQAAARNTGIAVAKYPYLYMGDDDSYITPDSIAILLQTIKEYEADIVGARAIYMKKDGSLRLNQKDKLFELNHRFDTNWALDTGGVVEAPILAACCLMKTELARAIQYDEWYRGNGMREETDFFVRANKAGAKILFNPKACQINLPRHQATGGARSMGGLMYQFYTIKNTLYFFNKHWDFLYEKYQLKHNRQKTKFLFLANRAKALLIRRLRRLHLLPKHN